MNSEHHLHTHKGQDTDTAYTDRRPQICARSASVFAAWSLLVIFEDEQRIKWIKNLHLFHCFNAVLCQDALRRWFRILIQLAVAGHLNHCAKGRIILLRSSNLFTIFYCHRDSVLPWIIHAEIAWEKNVDIWLTPTFSVLDFWKSTFIGHVSLKVSLFLMTIFPKWVTRYLAMVSTAWLSMSPPI